MKRSWLILLLGLALGGAGYFAVYAVCTAHHRAWRAAPQPELAWLKQEFDLGDAEYARICELHNAYLPECQARCRRIDAKNQELRELLARSNGMTPEIKQALSEAAQLRAECQAAMLRHFYEVSRAMPPAQGKRYRDWVIRRTLTPQHAEMSSMSAANEHRAP